MASGRTRRFSIGDDLGLAAWAVAARLGLSRPTGPLFLIGAMLDPFIYAAVVYFVLDRVFGLSGIDRYQFLLIGFISFRWTLSCMLDARTLGELAARMVEAGRPRWLAVLLVTLPPTAVMLLSLAAAFALSLLLATPEQSFRALPWLVLVLAVQAIWNAVLVLLIDRLAARFPTIGELPFVVVAGLLWLLSPVMYKFADVPEGANLLFTTLNPASHVLAGYYNAYWYGSAVSLDVLPAAGLAGLAIAVWLAARTRPPAAGAGYDELATCAAHPHLVIVVGSGLAETVARHLGAAEGAPVFGRWTGAMKALTGRDITVLIAKAWPGRGKRIAEIVERIRRISRLDRLFDDHLSIYPDWALAQLAFAVALESPHRRLVLDGLLDPADMLFRRHAWAELEAAAAAGRRITVVTERLLELPGAAQGSFSALNGVGLTRSGAIGAELSEFYAAYLGGNGIEAP